MGIFNQQPNYNQSYTTGKRGITGPQGPPGPKGVGFNLTSDGNYDVVNKKLVNVAEGTNSDDAVNKRQVDNELNKKADLTKSSAQVFQSRVQVPDFVLASHSVSDIVNLKHINNTFLSKISGGIMDNVIQFNPSVDNNKKQIHNLGSPQFNSSASNKKYVDDSVSNKLDKSGGLMTGNIDMNNKRIYNLAQPNDNNQPATKIWSENKFNNKIANLADPTSNNDVVNKSYVDTKLATKANSSVLQNVMRQTLYKADKAELNNYLKLDGTNSMTGDLNMSNNQITHLSDPKNATDAINKQYLEKSHVKPSHYNNEFKYLMTNRLAWTDLEPNNIDSFDITKIDNLMPQDGNYHQYNHKVLYTTIIKDQQGGYSYKMGINCYQLDKDKDHTLCIEILNSDYQLWHKSVATIDKTTSKGVSVAGFTVQKFSHRYTNSSGNTAYMYYIKIIVNFQKTVSGTFYSLDLYVNIPQTGIDINTYPKNWTNNWMIAYGVFGKVSSIDPQKTYDYHTAFDIKPTEVVYNVDLDMNRKKILNISPDRTINNSAATVKMVNDLEAKLSPHTKNNVYRKIFEEFYDLSDASIYKIQTRRFGVVFTGLLPNIYFANMFIANIEEGGLRIQNKPISLRLFGKKSFTLCVVMQLWLNRNMYIKTFMRDGADEMPHLIYDKTTKKLKLQTNGLTGSTNETSITVPNSFNGKRVVFWLTKKGTGGNFTVKASISNYSGTLTISSELASQSNYTFKISSEDTKI